MSRKFNYEHMVAFERWVELEREKSPVKSKWAAGVLLINHCHFDRNSGMLVVEDHPIVSPIPELSALHILRQGVDVFDDEAYPTLEVPIYRDTDSVMAPSHPTEAITIRHGFYQRSSCGVFLRLLPNFNNGLAGVFEFYDEILNIGFAGNKRDDEFWMVNIDETVGTIDKAGHRLAFQKLTDATNRPQDDILHTATIIPPVVEGGSVFCGKRAMVEPMHFGDYIMAKLAGMEMNK